MSSILLHAPRTCHDHWIQRVIYSWKSFFRPLLGRGTRQRNCLQKKCYFLGQFWSVDRECLWAALRKTKESYCLAQNSPNKRFQVISFILKSLWLRANRKRPHIPGAYCTYHQHSFPPPKKSICTKVQPPQKKNVNPLKKQRRKVVLQDQDHIQLFG